MITLQNGVVLYSDRDDISSLFETYEVMFDSICDDTISLRFSNKMGDTYFIKLTLADLISMANKIVNN